MLKDDGIPVPDQKWSCLGLPIGVSIGLVLRIGLALGQDGQG